MATEKQVTDQQAKNEKLRQRIADLNAKRVTDEQEAANATRLRQLEIEERQLQTELDYQQRLADARKALDKKKAPVGEAVAAPAAVGTTVQTPVDRDAETTAPEATSKTSGKGK